MAKKKPAETKPAALRAEAEAAAERSGAAMSDYGETKSDAADTVGESAQDAVAAQEEARVAQANVDRLEQHTRSASVASEDLPGNKPSGVVGDAWGGPAAERENVEDLKEKAAE